MFKHRRASLSEIEFSVPGMACEGCADTIHAGLVGIEGVEQVNANAWRKRVRVHYDAAKIDSTVLKGVLASMGYEVSKA